MRKVDQNALYDEDLNTWIRRNPLSNDCYQVGITDWAQGYMGYIQSLEYSVEIDMEFNKDTLFATLITDKISTDLHLPVAAKIINLNSQLVLRPSLINEDCYDKGWLVEVSLINQDELSKLKSSTWYEGSIDSFFKKGG